MSEDIETKQEYLRSQILEKGYNAEKFSEYMNEMSNGKGLDLDKWTLDELSQIVFDFQSNNEVENNENPPESNKEQNEAPKNQSIQEKVPISNIEKKDLGNVTEDFEIINKEDMKPSKNNKSDERLDIIICKKQERNAFTEQPDLRVTISKYIY